MGYTAIHMRRQSDERSIMAVRSDLLCPVMKPKPFNLISLSYHISAFVVFQGSSLGGRSCYVSSNSNKWVSSIFVSGKRGYTLRKVHAGAKLNPWNHLASISITHAIETNTRSGLPGIVPAAYALTQSAERQEKASAVRSALLAFKIFLCLRHRSSARGRLKSSYATG
jgi:hypothetical protein